MYKRQKDKSGNIVAVYYASGEITDYAGSSASDEGIVGSKVSRDLRKLDVYKRQRYIYAE